MSNVSDTVPETIPQSGTPACAPAEPSPECPESDVLNDDVMIELAPERPSGTIRVKLVYEGRSTPLPAEDPSSV